MADKDPTIPFYAQDFLVDTIQLPEHLVGAYIRLLCTMWVNKFCYADAKALAMVSPSAKEVVELLKDKFVFNGNGTFTSRKLEEVREKRRILKEIRTNAGKIGLQKRWQRDSKEDSKKIANVTVTEIETVNDIVKEWNELAERHKLTKVIKITDKRISNIKQRLAEADFNIYHIFQRIEESDFLLGKVKDWRVDFDFIFGSKNNWVKIMEGKYANNKGSIRKPNFVSSEEIADELNQAFSKSRAAT